MAQTNVISAAMLYIRQTQMPNLAYITTFWNADLTYPKHDTLQPVPIQNDRFRQKIQLLDAILDFRHIGFSKKKIEFGIFEFFDPKKLRSNALQSQSRCA